MLFRPAKLDLVDPVEYGFHAVGVISGPIAVIKNCQKSLLFRRGNNSAVSNASSVSSTTTWGSGFSLDNCGGPVVVIIITNAAFVTGGFFLWTAGRNVHFSLCLISRCHYTTCTSKVFFLRRFYTLL